MKKLQNNFTTPEQSKRLLELGVPADSADCFFTDSGKREIKNTPFDILYTPCWSVGRLIEIYEMVSEEAPQCITTKKSCTRIENLVSLFKENAALLDFSKLEE